METRNLRKVRTGVVSSINGQNHYRSRKVERKTPDLWQVRKQDQKISRSRRKK